MKMTSMYALHVLFLVAFTSIASAASIESLVMPGPVIEGHMEIEEECGSCHNLFDRSAQRQLCLDCHERIAKDINVKKGFHSLHPEARVVQCKQCHSEHEGRAADIVGLLREVFDHDLTDFPLKGNHAEQGCTACHQAKPIQDTGKRTPTRITYFDTPTKCTGCHLENDVHQGNFGEACDDCHDSSTWKSGRFDHYTTDFHLEGRHAEAACISCHVDQLFAETGSTCIDCHRLDDAHGGENGDLCGDCHNSESWRTDFNHSLETGFTFEGAHELLTCRNCHVFENEYKGLPDDCHGCHGADDVHLGRNGSECESCHNQRNWETSFNHLEKTGYKLVGSHDGQSCTACHTGSLSDTVANECNNCHQNDDPHGETLTLCTDCHAQTHWDDALRFHHDLSDFPLVGLHRTATCEQCHESLVFSSAAGDCQSCHANEDVHFGALGSGCATCHNPVGWDFWLFAHNEQSKFPFTGAHEGLVCNACHRTGKSPDKLGSACATCHRADDVHRGGFGKKCDHCHKTDTFLEPTFNK
jgi:hypothetical protein